MLLKSIKMTNFRQFIDEEISFSTDENKNVTIIMAENGSGKTTASQAFSWCFFGQTDFEDNLMLNKKIADQMMQDDEKTVEVQIKLIHAKKEYTIVTRQSYKKDYTGKLKPSLLERKVAYKNEDGQQEFVRPLDTENVIKQILPKDLLRYFFFDGERIGKMGKDITRKGKSEEFVIAVRGLLGLGAFEAALKHLDPNSRVSVIGNYNKSYSADSNNQIIKLNEEIEKYQDELNSKANRIKDLNDSIQKAKDRIEQLNDKIKESVDGEKLQDEKRRIQRKLESALSSKETVISNMLKDFSTHSLTYFSRILIKQALDDLSKLDLIGKDIPNINAKTINYLIKKGECICGTTIKDGNDAFQALKHLLEYIPPKSIGVSVGEFVKESKLRVRNSIDLYGNIKDTLAIVKEQEDNLAEYNIDINRIEEKLIANKGSANYLIEQRTCDKTIEESEAEILRLSEIIGEIKYKKSHKENERRNLSLMDEQNKKIELYKAYAQAMYEKLLSIYNEQETKMRKKLETTINNIFSTIYNGGLALNIDDKYNIEVVVKDNDISVETSTAQNISVIFAFIAGVITLARESQQSDKSDLIYSEAYPLVMDAPLSAFDKKRIKSVCESLQGIAEQLIIFIKDTDGDIAKEHIGDKIGKIYNLDKLDELETNVKLRG